MLYALNFRVIYDKVVESNNILSSRLFFISSFKT